jgi:hypothetical protein
MCLKKKLEEVRPNLTKKKKTHLDVGMENFNLLSKVSIYLLFGLFYFCILYFNPKIYFYMF